MKISKYVPVYGNCLICCGVIIPIHQFEDLGYYCKDCGIYYKKLPSKKIREKLRKEKESILRMSPNAKKKFAKKLDKIQSNLNHNRRMKKI
jgi:hypothetical protein